MLAGLTIESPVGPLHLVARDGALCALHLDARGPAGDDRDRVLGAAARQLEEYFAGRRRAFELPLRLDGTLFQQRVWRKLLEIPYGATSSYAELARAVGQPSAMRAVGAANGRNPIAIIVPCHRVVGKDGGLTGYAGGLATKRWLLAHERPPPLSAASRQNSERYDRAIMRRTRELRAVR